MKLKYILLLVLGGFLFYSCEPEIEAYNYSSGSADFSTYVALGNSLTAGYADGALYKESQQTSSASILAGQLKKVGSGEFAQPYMPTDDGVGISATPQGILFRTKTVVGYSTDCLGTTSLAPVPANPDADQGQLQAELMTPVPGTYNNFGVPGAKSFHLLAPGYGDPNGVMQGTANPYFARFASSPQTSVLGDAIGRNPTFYTLWVGGNDILGYAGSGGVADTLTGQQSFAYFVNTILTNLDAAGAKGAIANIPDISSSPFFTTVPPNGYVLTQGQADTLNLFLGSFGFSYQAGPNYFIIEDASTQLGFRQMVEGEMVLLTVPQDSLKCAYWGGFNPVLQAPVPIPGMFILDAEEVSAVNNAVAGYNQTIYALAEQYGIAHVDMNSFMNMLETGYTLDGESFSSDFITGNAFSLDGIHGTPKGNALMANEFIMAINKKYGSTIPTVSTTAYRANILP